MGEAALVLGEVEARPTRTREAELAYMRYRGDGVGRIPEQAKREARNFKRGLEAGASAIEAAVASGEWRALARGYLKRGAVDRPRTLDRLRRLFAPAGTVDVGFDVPWLSPHIMVQWLEPARRLIAIDDSDKGFSQESTTVHMLDISALRREAVSAWLVPLDVPEHALWRLHHRCGLMPQRVLREAALNFLAGEARAIIGFERQDSLALPCGGGWFLCNVVMARIKGGEAWRIVCRPRTWVQKLWPDQVPLAPASDQNWSVLSCSWALLHRGFGSAPSPAVFADRLHELDVRLEEAVACPTT